MVDIIDAHKFFKVEVDKNANNIGIAGSPSFLPEEIDYFLNSAYYMTIATKVTGNNTLQIPFEGNIKRVSDLEKLVKVDRNLTLLSETSTNRLTLNDFTSTIKYGSLSQDKRMYFISGILHFSNTGKNANVRLINHMNASKFLQTYNNKPWIEEPVAVLEDNKLVVYVDQDLMSGPYTIDITYMAYPRKLNNEELTSGFEDVPDTVAYEVIKLAADMAIENIGSQRVQTHSQYIGATE